MTTALDNLVTDAAAAAANFQPAAGASTALAPAPAVGGALAKPSMDAFLDGGGMDVEEYVRLNDTGFRFGDKMAGLFDDAIVTIDMTQVTPIHSFRYEVGGSTKFIKSYDGETTSTGENFMQAVATAQRLPGVKASGIYPTVEIPFELTETMTDPKKGSDISFAAGTKIGYTPSVTGFKCFQAFAKKLRAENPALLSETITVKISHAARVNNQNNKWGVIEFATVA